MIEIHQAGRYLDTQGLQYCDRCGEVLTDYRGAMIPVGDPPLAGWATGAFVEITEGNPRQFVVTTHPPTCEAVEDDSIESHGLL